jgi:hypothetical protein
MKKEEKKEVFDNVNYSAEYNLREDYFGEYDDSESMKGCLNMLTAVFIGTVLVVVTFLVWSSWK